MSLLSLYITRKLSLAKDGKQQSPAVLVAIIGVALSISIMILSVAIVIGFKNEIKNKVVGFNSHIVIFPQSDSNNYESNIINSDEIANVLSQKIYIKDWTPIVSAPAIFKTDTEFKGIYLRGVSENYNFTFLKDNIISGEVPSFAKNEDANKVIISESIAKQLSLNVGDKINSYFISNDIKVRPLIVAAIYNTHFEDYDNLYVYGSTTLLQELNDMAPNHATAIEIITDDINKSEEYAADLNTTFVENVITGKSTHLYKISTIARSGESYWSWLALLDTNVIIIIILMILVSCFTLISVMLILILEKVRFIGIMKAMGASNKLLRSIFRNLSIKIAIIGLVIGNLLSLTIIYIQDRFHFLKLDPESYYIDFVPVDIDLLNILFIDFTAIIIIWILLLLPSKIAGKISPVKTIRFD